MTNCRGIDKVKLLFFFTAAAIALLAGHCQGASHDEILKHDDADETADEEAVLKHDNADETTDDESYKEVMKIVENKKKLREEANLFGLNFAVQKQILETFYKKASKFAKIFDTNLEEMNGIKKKLVGAYWKLAPEKKYLCDLDRLMAKALYNLRTDVSMILKEFPSIFAIKPELNALTEWLDLAYQQQQQQELGPSDHRVDAPKMPQEHPDSKQLFKPEQVNPILHELDPVLEQMSSSTQRMEWRNEVNVALKRQQMKKRIDYDSMYVRLAIVRATFHTGKTAYAEKERVEEKRKTVGKKKITAGEKKAAENQQEVAAAAATIIDHQQKNANKLAVAIKNMEYYAENLERARAQLETALRDTWEWDDKIWIERREMYDSDKGYDKLGFNGRDGFQFNELAHGDMELFAQMLGKTEPYVPAVDGPEVVLKYQLMLNAATVWKLRYDVIPYINKQTERENIKEEIAQNRREGDEYKRKMDGQAKYTYPGGEKAWQANRDDLFARGHCPPLR